MRNRLSLSLFTAIIFMVVVGTAFAHAAEVTDQDTDVTALKADENRTNKLRHGYIKHDKDKVYYYW